MMRCLGALLIVLAIGCSSDDDDPAQPGDSTPDDNTGTGGASQSHAGTGATHASGGTSGSADAGHTPSGNARDAGDAAAEHDADLLDSGTADASAPAVVESSACLDEITDYTHDGSFAIRAEQVDGVRLWVPDVPKGCKVPIIHWSNGTGATCSNYEDVLVRLANHGFLTTCFESPSARTADCIAAVEIALREHPDIAAHKFASMGHDTGGAIALSCVRAAEQKWGDAMTIVGHATAPASGFGGDVKDWQGDYAAIESPTFMFNTSQGGLVSAGWVEDGFDALNDAAESYWYEASGAADLPLPTPWMQESAVVWVRWKLLGDKQACAYFKQMPDGAQWDMKNSRNETDCE